MSVTTNVSISPVDVKKRAQIGVQPGATVRVWQKIQEKGKTRLQAYEGLVIARKHGIEPGATFTVRKVASGVGMEKIFPLYSPNIDKIEVLRASKVRRSKLYYIREKAAKEIRRRMKHIGLKLGVIDETEEEVLAETPAEETTEEMVVAETTETQPEEAAEVTPEPEESTDTPAEDQAPEEGKTEETK